MAGSKGTVGAAGVWEDSTLLTTSALSHGGRGATGRGPCGGKEEECGQARGHRLLSVACWSPHRLAPPLALRQGLPCCRAPRCSLTPAPGSPCGASCRRRSGDAALGSENSGNWRHMGGAVMKGRPSSWRVEGRGCGAAGPGPALQDGARRLVGPHLGPSWEALVRESCGCRALRRALAAPPRPPSQRARPRSSGGLRLCTTVLASLFEISSRMFYLSCVAGALRPSYKASVSLFHAALVRSGAR